MTLGERVDVKYGKLELDETLNGQEHEAVESETEKEGGEPSLQMAGLGCELFVIVDAISAGYDDEEETQEVGKYEMSEKEIGLVEPNKASEFEKCDEKSQIE